VTFYTAFLHELGAGVPHDGLAASFRKFVVIQLRIIPRSSSLIRAGQQLMVSGGAAPNQLHNVRRGDTLSGIAQRYGMTLSELRNANGLPRRSSLIRAGQQLTVFGTGTVAQSRSQLHVVTRGETLSHIATRYRVRLTDLLRTNGLSLSSLIHPGQQLQIP
jgi:LysM repeat protein